MSPKLITLTAALLITVCSLAQSEAREFKLDTPLPNANPGKVVTEQSISYVTTPTPVAPESPAKVDARPLIGAATEAPASEPTPAKGVGEPVKAYTSLAQAAADGLNPLADTTVTAAVAPIESTAPARGLVAEAQALIARYPQESMAAALALLVLLILPWLLVRRIRSPG